METLRFRHGRKRTNGFDSPYHRDQIISSLLYCTCTVGQFLICSAFLPSNGFIKYGVIILSATLSIITSINGILTTISNPEAFPDDKPMPLWCGRKSPRITRLCLDCQKTVLEFDHHCSFMNNCIGSKNYVPFIVMISCGSMQMVLQCITTILVQTYFYNISIVQNSFNLWVFYLLLALEIAISAFLGLGMLCLSCFHFYLYFIAKLGTCDWALERRRMRTKVYLHSSSKQSVLPQNYEVYNGNDGTNELSMSHLEGIEDQHL